MASISELFRVVKLVEELAKTLLSTYSKPLKNECFYLARRIVNFKASDTFPSVQSQFSKMVDFYKQSFQGFFC